MSRLVHNLKVEILKLIKIKRMGTSWHWFLRSSALHTDAFLLRIWWDRIIIFFIFNYNYLGSKLYTLKNNKICAYVCTKQFLKMQYLKYAIFFIEYEFLWEDISKNAQLLYKSTENNCVYFNINFSMKILVIFYIKKKCLVDE